MGDESSKWIKQAEADLKSAKDNLDSNNYYLVAFLCHQVIEKGFKALYIEKEQEMPPRIHDLLLLSKKIGLPVKYSESISKIDPAYAIARYPDVSEGVPSELYEKEETRNILDKTGEVFRWIKERFEKLCHSSLV